MQKQELLKSRRPEPHPQLAFVLSALERIQRCCSREAAFEFSPWSALSLTKGRMPWDTITSFR
jgi:hypothetical protein